MEQKLDRLVSRTYACALGLAPWSDLAAELAQALDSPSAVLRRACAQADIGVISSTDNFRLGSQDAAEVQHWFERDLWAERAAGRGLGQIVETEALVDEHSLQHSGFYQDWLRPLGIHHGIGCVFEHADLGTLVLGVHRASGSPSFDAPDALLLRRWLPHLSQALSLGRQPPAAPDAGAGDALLLLDAQGRLSWRNEPARALLHEGRLLTLAPPPLLRLREPLAGAQPWLRAQLMALAGSREPPMPAAWRPATPASEALLLRAAPVRLAELAGTAQTPHLLLMLRQPQQRRLDLPLLAELYRLTQAETRVLDGLCRGLSAKAIARLHAVQANTVQAQIKHLLQKTGTRRQPELLALALRTGLSN